MLYQLLTGALFFSAAGPAFAGCENLIPETNSEAVSHHRELKAEDLIQLREVGFPDSSYFSLPPAMALSPNGQTLAFVMSKADVSANHYCRGLVTIDIRSGARPALLNSGGEYIILDEPVRGFYLKNGGPRIIIPVWSPDGSRIAWLRQDKGIVQAWVVDVSNKKAREVTYSQTDVQHIAWSTDGQRLIYAVRKGEIEEKHALDQEGMSGWLYDKRVSPEISARPRPAIRTEYDVKSIDLASGREKSADDGDHAELMKISKASDVPYSGAADIDGSVAALEPVTQGAFAPMRPVVTAPDGSRLLCEDARCAGKIIFYGWHDRQLYFVKREGWAKETMGLYRWKPGETVPAPIMQTKDTLHDCIMAGGELVCTRENSVSPRKIVGIDIESGKDRLILDLNPEFASVRLGEVKRLRWKNKFGLEARGDLVLPPGYKPGTRLPLIVVQYYSDGFLRGGTGDEYPIHLLAQRGFAVLGFGRPAIYASLYPDLKDWDKINEINTENQNERWSLLSAVLEGVRLAVKDGYADPEKAGITGLSDGASTAEFALLNSTEFSAAAISTCCMAPYTTAIYGGLGWAEKLQSTGYPSLTDGDALFWQSLSLASGIQKKQVPLLMQFSDDEFRLGLETFGTLHEQRKPVEMYVYPGEFHIKWQPAHRMAVYRRNLEWFSFWLKGQEDESADNLKQYERWRKLRSAMEKPTPPADTGG